MNVINLTFTVEPIYLNANLKTKIEEKTRNLLLNKEIKDVGIITNIKNIQMDSLNLKILRSGNVECKVKVNVSTYLPKVGDKLTTKIKTVSFHGYYLDEPLDIFIATNKEENKLKEGDKINVIITKLKFLDGKFIVLANKL